MKLRAAHALLATTVFAAPDEVSPLAAEALADVAVAGCASLERIGLCHLGESRTLTLWFPSPSDGAVSVSADGAPLSVRSNSVDAGRQLAFDVPPGTAEVVVRIESAGRTFGWRQRGADVVDTPALQRARDARGAGDLDAAEAALDDLDTDDDALSARALSLRARLALARGDAESASELFERAIATHEAIGQTSLAARDGVALAYTRHQLAHDFAGAERALAIATRNAAIARELQTDVETQAGTLALDAAAPGRALEHFESAERWARRLDMDDARWFANQMRATVLMRLGRADEADALLAHIDAEDEDDCVAAHLDSTRAWIALLREESRVGGSPDVAMLDAARASAMRALDRFETSCRRANSAADTAGTLALLHTTLGDAEDAKDALAHARELSPRMPFDLASWMHDADARVHLLEGRDREAAAAYRELRRRAEDVVHHEAAWRASFGYARTAAEAEDRIEALRHAESILDDEVATVPMGTGRDTLAARRNRTAAALVSALLDQGDADAALLAARRARSRAVRALDQHRRLDSLDDRARAEWLEALGRYRRGRAEVDAELAQRWSLSTDAVAAFDARMRARIEGLRRDLASAYTMLGRAPEANVDDPPPGVALWLAQRLADEEAPWVLFLRDEAGVSVVRRGAIPEDDEDLAAWAFDGFGDRVASLERLALFAPEPLASRDLHALEWRGAPLLASMDVVYPLDVAQRPRGVGDGVFVVSDPTQDLPHARDEQSLWRGAGAEVVAGADAERARVLDGLSRAEAFHYSGHGETRGALGWESRLRLAGGTHLTPSDVLASEGVPSVVVLSGCETARTSDDASRVQGMGIAPAFVLAGADVVLATSRPVSDAVARALAERLAASDAPTLAQLRDAVLALRVDYPDEWGSYRLITANLGGMER